MMHKIVFRSDLMGINEFSKFYGIDRTETMRLINRNYLSGLQIKDGSVTRIFIDNSVILAEAKENNMRPSEWISTICRWSKK